MVEDPIAALGTHPDRTAAIVRSLPEDLVLAVARRLLDDGEYIVLGRFVSVVSDRIARRVIETATGEQLLQISFYAEDRARLDELLAHLDDARLAGVVQAAADRGQFDEAVSLLVFLGPGSQERLSRTLTSLGTDVADGVVAAVVRLAAWTELLPVVGSLSADVVRLLVNVPTMRDPAVISGLIDQVREQTDLVEAARDRGFFAMIVTVIEALDDEHRAVLGQVVGVSGQTIDAAVEAFRSGDQLPPELLEALAALAAPGARSTPATRAGERG